MFKLLSSWSLDSVNFILDSLFLQKFTWPNDGLYPILDWNFFFKTSFGSILDYLFGYHFQFLIDFLIKNSQGIFLINYVYKNLLGHILDWFSFQKILTRIWQEFSYILKKHFLKYKNYNRILLTKSWVLHNKNLQSII